jgi:hypothetical protein
MTEPKRIHRQRTKGWKMPENTVYVGRPSFWGNPFPVDDIGVAMECLPMGLDGEEREDRAEAAKELYRRWLTGGEVNELIAAFLPPVPKPISRRKIRRELAGKNLACWCPVGSPCHADVLLEIANSTSQLRQVERTKKGDGFGATK